MAGKKIYAARVIMRAWLRCRDMKRFKALKEAWELEQSQNVIEDILEEGKELLLDMDDIQEDIKVGNAPHTLKRLVSSLLFIYFRFFSSFPF